MYLCNEVRSDVVEITRCVLHFLSNHCSIIDNMMNISLIANCVLAVMAVIAGVVSWFEFRSHKQKENNKLLSQLNQRYISNQDIQTVVRYLREIDPDNIAPRPYQTELFLRFFEELGVYLRHNNLPKDDVVNFFGFYLTQMYESDRGKQLLARINNEEKEWVYLNDYKRKVKFPY